MMEYEIHYRASWVMSFHLIAVDGHRAELPMPDPGTTNVPRLNYELAAAVDTQHSLDEYMQRSGLVVY